MERLGFIFKLKIALTAFFAFVPRLPFVFYILSENCRFEAVMMVLFVF